MNDFNTLFPNFANQCAEMNRVLLPIAFVLLVVGIVSSTITGQRSPGAYLRTFGRTLAFLAVLSQLTVWGNQVGGIVDKTVKWYVETICTLLMRFGKRGDVSTHREGGGDGDGVGPAAPCALRLLQESA